MNMVAYCRVSTDKEDQLNSLETQKKFFEEYAIKNNYNLIKVYADEGISGTKLKNRDAFLQVIRDCESGAFQMVAVKDISRYARNTLDFIRGIRFMKSKGIVCNFVNANLSSTDSEMILVTMAALAQEESANTSKRIKFSKKMNAEKGKVPNLVYGYDKIIGDYFNLNINEKEAETVRRIYDLYINEGFGANKIAKTLNNEGIKTKRECDWTQNGVSRILANPIYIGKIINGKEEIEDFLTGVRTKKNKEDWYVCDRPDLAIIDEKTFEKAQRTLAKNREAFDMTGKRNCSKYVFSTLLCCTHCGHSYRRFQRTYKNTIITWGCAGRNANGVDFCSNDSVLYEDKLIESISEYFKELITDKNAIIKKVVADFNKHCKLNAENQKSERKLQNEIKSLKKKRQKYMDMYENDVISIADLKANTAEINASIAKCEDKLKIAKYNLSQGDKLTANLADTITSIDEIMRTDNITNESLKKVTERIDISEGGKVDVYLKLYKDTEFDEAFAFGADCAYEECIPKSFHSN